MYLPRQSIIRTLQYLPELLGAFLQSLPLSSSPGNRRSASHLYQFSLCVSFIEINIILKKMPIYLNGSMSQVYDLFKAVQNVKDVVRPQAVIITLNSRSY